MELKDMYLKMDVLLSKSPNIEEINFFFFFFTKIFILSLLYTFLDSF